MYLLSDELKTYDHRVGICELMMLSILNHFSLFDLLVVFDWWTHINSDATLSFWLIMRSGRWNVMNHIPTKEGTIFDRRGAGNSFTMSLTATRGSSWPYMDFIFFVTSVPGGGGYALIWHMGVAYPYMGTPQRRGFLGCLKCPLSYYTGTLKVLERCKTTTTTTKKQNKTNKHTKTPKKSIEPI